MARPPPRRPCRRALGGPDHPSLPCVAGRRSSAAVAARHSSARPSRRTASSIPSVCSTRSRCGVEDVDVVVGQAQQVDHVLLVDVPLADDGEDEGCQPRAVGLRPGGHRRRGRCGSAARPRRRAGRTRSRPAPGGRGRAGGRRTPRTALTGSPCPRPRALGDQDVQLAGEVPQPGGGRRRVLVQPVELRGRRRQRRRGQLHHLPDEHESVADPVGVAGRVVAGPPLACQRAGDVRELVR